MRKSLPDLREYLGQYIEKHGPGQGSGKKRGGFTASMFQSQVIARSGQQHGLRTEQKTKREVKKLMVDHGHSAKRIRKSDNVRPQNFEGKSVIVEGKPLLPANWCKQTITPALENSLLVRCDTQ